MPGSQSWPTDRASLRSLLSVAVLMAVSSGLIGGLVLHYQALQMDFDEAVHASRGLDMAVAVQHGTSGDIWHQIVKPHLYPPGHGALLGAWLLALGPGVASARLYSTACFFLMGIVLWAATRDIDRKAYGFWLVPPSFLLLDFDHVSNAAMSMLEIPAILFSLGSLLFVNRSLFSGRAIDTILCAGFFLAAFFTKYNYGLTVAATLAVSYFVLALFGENPARQRREQRTAAVVWLVTGALLLVWLFGLGEWKWLVAYASAQPTWNELWSASNLLYYPREVLSHSSGWLAALLFLPGAFLWLKARKIPAGLVPYAVFFGVYLLLLTLKLQNLPRLAMPLLPSLWIGSAVAAASFCERLPRTGRRLLWGCLLTALVSAGALEYSRAGRHFAESYENVNDEVDAAYDFAAEAIRTGSGTVEIVVAGRTDQWNGEALGFHLRARHFSSGPQNISVGDDSSIRFGWPVAKIPEPEQMQRLVSACREADYLVWFKGRFDGPIGWTTMDQWREVGRRDVHFERDVDAPFDGQVLVFERRAPNAE